MKQPLISILIPTFNRASLIGRAINSVFAQDYADYDLVVVDDASVDNTREVVAALNDGRIHYVRHDQNKGIAGARNTALQHARGEWIAFLDSDDYWYPDKLTQQVGVVQKYPEVDFIFTNGYFKKEEHVLFQTEKSSGVIPKGEKHFPLKDIFTLPSSWFFRKSLAEKVGPLDSNVPMWEDGDFFVRAADRGCVYFLNERLVFWYSPQENFSLQKELEARELFLEKQRARMQKDKEYLTRFLKTLAKDYLRVGNGQKARTFLAQALTMQPFNGSLWSKYARSFI